MNWPTCTPSCLESDEAKIRGMILEQVLDLRRRTVRNVEVIGEELRLRNESDVDEEMSRQRSLQRSKGEQFFRSRRSESVLLVALMVLSPLPVLLFGLYRTVVRPVSRLAQATARARTGDLSFRLPVHSRDEVGSLETSFNRMIEELETSREEIQEANANLERRVDAKTSELSQALERERASNRRLETALAELRDTQAQLIHAEKMAGLGQLSASIAHEFNNLLGGILGSTEAVREDVPEGSVREALDVVHRAARRGCGITENLLRFSRSEEAHKEPSDLDSVVDECTDLLRAEISDRKIRLERERAEGPPVPMDAGQIHQVVTNLLTNAMEAVGREGSIRVRTEIEGSTARILVEDDGPGVESTDRTRIFEPFFTKRTTSSGAAPGTSRGTGLGLAVSYGIVAAHGGTLRVEDRTDASGARFVVELPLDAPTERKARLEP